MLPPSTTVFNNILSIDTIRNIIITLRIFIAALIIVTRTKILHNSLNALYFIVLNLTLLFILLVCFSASSIFIFYISFEASLIPTILIIIIWGYQPERVQARIYIIIYTIIASVPIFTIFLYLYSRTKNSNIFINSQLLFNTR